MDFDEYDYLEKTVEDVEIPKEKRKDDYRKDEKGSRHRERDAGESRSERKSSRSGEENGDSKREDRDRSDRSRDKDRDEGRDRRRDREREREKDRDRERRSRDRDYKDKDKGRDRERDREKDRERETERERETSRSRRSSSRSRHEAEREMERARSRERAVRERELEREIRERESRRFKEKKEAEPEADPERDQRTVFAYQMPLKATERDVYEFFSKAGKVRDVRLIMDRNSRRSKGVGYIEFYDAMSVPMAIALSGQLLLGQPVMVKPSEAEKNLVQSTATGGTGVTGAGAARKIYVGNLHFNISEDQLRQVFEPFGPVELVQLPLDLETGQCKGYGFVQFAQMEHAKAAQSLNGKLEIAGRVIKVSAVTDHVAVQETGANTADFDDDDGGGLSLNARSRAMLMQKLDRTGTASSIAESLGVPLVNGVAQPNQQALPLPANGQAILPVAPALVTNPHASVPIGEPSECIQLKNMFDPRTETDPDFDLDIRDEVQDECSKFGPVKHIYVDKHSDGHVYLRFETVTAAASCQHAMHMRWFAGRAICATFMQPYEYEAKFAGGA
ncbi:RNA-binding protein 39-like [Asparagus officinalis]|nr:RNA-binding protein 39-like [Asparagus officinalis]